MSVTYCSFVKFNEEKLVITFESPKKPFHKHCSNAKEFNSLRSLVAAHLEIVDLGEANKPKQAYATAMRAKRDTERLYMETPQQEAIRANIEATKRMVSEVYKDNPDKLKSVLQTLEDKISDVMSGKLTLPQLEVRQEPQRAEIKQKNPSLNQDLDR